MLDAFSLSDVHLGSRLCRTHHLTRFLRERLPETRYLIINGDLVDSPHGRLREEDWAVLYALKSIGEKSELIWVRGNHDPEGDDLAALIGAKWVDAYRVGDVLFAHGHLWDHFIAAHPWLTALADLCYLGTQRISQGLATRLKHRCKTYQHCTRQVHSGAAFLAANRDCHTVVCGHTHNATDEKVRGVRVVNSGCWTEPVCHYVTVEGDVVRLEEYRA